jgi:DNA-binding CsgD family transcriptional regulator
MVDITKSPFFSYNDIVDYLVEPITKQVNLKPLMFSRYYPNRERFLICRHKEFAEDYYANKLYQYGHFEIDTRKLESNFHMWDHFPCDPNGLYAHVRRDLGLAHGLTIVQQHGDYCDFFAFATAPGNTSINNFYLNQKELFVKFINDYYSAFAPAFEELSNHTFFIPMKTDKSSTTIKTLSSRQQDCALLLADGLTSKEIAKKLQLSPRTVEEHVNTLKIKFEAKNRIHLSALLQRYI